MTVTATASDKARWETEGWCLLEGFMPDDLVGAAQDEVAKLFPSAEDFAEDRDPERNEPFRTDSHSVQPRFPFDAAVFNDLSLHESLMDLAEYFLGVSDLRLYQSMLSAKYGEGAESDEQLMHVDYGNHTLLVPRPDVGFQHLELFIYLNDVAESAATRVVSRQLTGEIPTERTYLNYNEYAHLYDAEVPAVGGSGSVFAYRSDVFHRGIRITEPATARFMLHVSFKPAHTDWLGFQSWPSAAESMAWHRFMQTATMRQLLMLGFPPPGHPYWNDDTLRGVAARYPALDMEPWRNA